MHLADEKRRFFVKITLFSVSVDVIYFSAFVCFFLSSFVPVESLSLSLIPFCFDFICVLFWLKMATGLFSLDLYPFHTED